MTYEPGQRVLVPAIVKGHKPDADPVWVQIPTVFGNRGGWVPAADIVGPAPATPGEGATYEPGQPISADWRRSYEQLTTGKLARLYELAIEQRSEARAALAAAEARIAAALALADQFEFAADGFGNPIEHGVGVDIGRAFRRALSVEATGPEGGGS